MFFFYFRQWTQRRRNKWPPTRRGAWPGARPTETLAQDMHRHCKWVLFSYYFFLIFRVQYEVIKRSKGRHITIHYCFCGRGSGHIVPVIALNALYILYMYIYLRTYAYEDICPEPLFARLICFSVCCCSWNTDVQDNDDCHRTALFAFLIIMMTGTRKDNGIVLYLKKF